MKRIILHILFLVALFLVAGCASTAKAPSVQSAPAIEGGAPQAIYDKSQALPETNLSTGETNIDSSGGAPKSSGMPSSTERIVINNGSLSIVVDDPAKSMDFIVKMAQEKGGFVVTSNLFKTTMDNGLEIPQASVTIRIPSDQLSDAMDMIKSLVINPTEDIRNEKVTGQDVTQEYTDTKSRLKNLENTRDQLREIMQSAQKTEDVLAVLNQLNQITEQIEVLQGQINFFDTSARYSAVSVEILSQEAVKPLSVGGWQPVGVARDAIQALINMVKFLVNLLIWCILFILPMMIFIFLPIRLAWVLFRRWQKKSKAQKSVNSEKVSPPINPASGEKK